MIESVLIYEYKKDIDGLYLRATTLMLVFLLWSFGYCRFEVIESDAPRDLSPRAHLKGIIGVVYWIVNVTVTEWGS